MNESEGHIPIKKKRKISPTEAFYDLLSRVHLTRHALKELDRRNFQERRHSQANNTIAEDFDLRNGGIDSAHLKIVARNGGPDVRDIGGYRKPRIERTIETMNPRSHCASDKEAFTNTKSSLKSSAYDANC
jgi:hypothetical protein